MPPWSVSAPWLFAAANDMEDEQMASVPRFSFVFSK